MWSQLSTSKQYVALPLLAIVLVSVTFAGTAVADPRIWVVSADVDQDTALVGEQVTVDVHVKNSGSSGGALTVSIEANGTEVGSERVQLSGNSEERVQIPISIDEPGEYRLSANDRNAGRLTVSNVKVASTTERVDGRTVVVRAGAVGTDTPLSATFPEVDNRSFAVESVTMTGTSEGYNRSVATYSPPTDAPFDVPTGSGSAVVGAVDVDSIPDTETTAFTVAIDRDALRDNDLQTDDVTAYALDDGTYVPVETSQASTTADAVVYEVATDGHDEFVVGSLSPAFAVESTRLSTSDVGEGQRINLTATVSNDGAVQGEYTAEMVVDGSTVAEETLTIPAGERAEVTLHHDVNARGDYEVALGDQSAGSVVITGDDVSAGDDSTGDDATPADEATDSPGDDAGQIGERLALPSLDGVGLPELGIGASVVLVGGGLLLLLRR